MRESEPSLLRRYFAGLAEHTFLTELGLADPPLVDYLSDLLARFARYDAIYRLRDLAGRRLEEVAQMMVEAQERVGEARREVHRHIGDFTLFWAGVYPEALRCLQRTDTADHLLDYCQQGKRAYWIASLIETDSEDEAPCPLLERLSLQFELCAYGLGEVRRSWERGDGEGLGRPYLIN